MVTLEIPSGPSGWLKPREGSGEVMSKELSWDSKPWLWDKQEQWDKMAYLLHSNNPSRVTLTPRQQLQQSQVEGKRAHWGSDPWAAGVSEVQGAQCSALGAASVGREARPGITTLTSPGRSPNLCLLRTEISLLF